MNIQHRFVRRIYVTIFYITILGIGGCVAYDASIPSWVGKPEAEIIKQWGNPDTTNTFSNGEKIHTWIQSGTNQYGPFTCRRSITINLEKKITKGSARGCPSLSTYEE